MTVVKDSAAPPSYSEVVRWGRRSETGETGPHSESTNVSDGTAIPTPNSNVGQPHHPSDVRQPLLTGTHHHYPSCTLTLSNHPSGVLNVSTSTSASTFPAPAPAPVAAPSSPLIHHYQNLHTGEIISSPLPPSHPAMHCLQSGTHISTSTHFGLVGILSAIVCFPVGLGCLLFDRTVICERCGEVLNEGCS